MDSEHGLSPGRQREIDTRLDAIRARLKQLRERDRGRDAIRRRFAAPSERLALAQRHAAEAQAAAAQVLASSVEAFRNAAEAHELAAGMHERTAEAGIGDVPGHQRQGVLHRAAAAADRQRAERVQSLLSNHERAGPAPVSGELRDGVTP